jgi:CIC family chloride channel protein
MHPTDRSLRSSRTGRLILLSALLGVLGAVAAQAFIAAISLVNRLFLGAIGGYSLPDGIHGDPHTTTHFGLWLVPISTTLGGLLVGVLVGLLAPEAEGHGTDAAVRAFHRLGGYVRRRIPVVKTIASALTIGSGGSAGREGPTAQIAAGIGSMLGTSLGLPVRERRLLLLAGIAAGVSAAFKSPLGAALLSVEVLYSEMDFEVDALVYSVIAAAIAYGVNGFFAGWTPVFRIMPGLTLHRAQDLSWYAALGLLAGLLSPIVPAALYRTERFFKRLPVHRMLRPALGGLLVGLVALVLPQTLGSGYLWMQRAVDGSLAVPLLLALAFVKVGTLALTIGSGGSGGVFAPSLYVGCMLGSAFGLATTPWFSLAEQAPHVAAMSVVGMAALFAGCGRVPLATVLMVAEMTGGYGLLVPTMLAVTIAFVVSSSLARRLGIRDPLLFESQVPSRADSPVHQSSYVAAAMDILGTEGWKVEVPLDWPSIDRLLGLGTPLPVGGAGHLLLAARISEVAAGWHLAQLHIPAQVQAVSVVRAGSHVAVTPDLELVDGDVLLLIGRPTEARQLSDVVQWLTPPVRAEAP